MNLYLVKRGGSVGYDEFDSFVICASDESIAWIHAKNESHGENHWSVEDGGTCIMIVVALDSTSEGLVLGSFNARVSGILRP